MSFTPATLSLMNSGINEGPNLFHYTTADAHTDVDETDYFTNGVDYGMKVNDVVFVIDTATPTTTVHRVASVDSDGNATIDAATLA